ncbi:MAG: winged helix-turn-helix transcriptional regulator [Candidatus Aenigmarchaeota archaeon]|nr:winged helix-turn-helix transcriptional regulator [Candidatus Aenigmarchaeota archaeon]
MIVFLLQMNISYREERGQSLFNSSRTESLEFGNRLANQSGNFSRERFLRPQNSFAYPIGYVSLMGSIISILAGISLLDILRKKEKAKITSDIIETMTTPDEKTVLSELEDAGGELTQSDLVKKTNLSTVKVHRVIKRLELLGIIKKYPYGMTNKIKLEKQEQDKK